MNRVLLDSSALLALLLGETGGDQLPRGHQFEMSTVNVSEVHTRLIRLARPTADLRAAVAGLVIAVPFTNAQAIQAAELTPLTQSRGLSLGDRACLAVAIEQNLDVYTADRKWSEVNLPCRVHIIR